MPSHTVKSFLSHIEKCHNICLPAGRVPLFFKNMLIGYVVPELCELLKESLFQPYLSFHPDKESFSLHRGDDLKIISQILEKKQIFNPFHEWFDIRLPIKQTEQNEIIGQIDRALIPLLGTQAEGVHLNGLVIKKNEKYLWVAKRSQTKRLDPGKLDHLVAGGICTGLSPTETLIKEALEEAQLPEVYTRHAIKTAIIDYAMLRPEGLRRDRLHCYDLILPEEFIPYAADGEVENFFLLPLQEIFERVRDTEDFKFNVSLVLIDLFLRNNLFNKEDTITLHNALFLPPSCIEEKKPT